MATRSIVGIRGLVLALPVVAACGDHGEPSIPQEATTPGTVPPEVAAAAVEPIALPPPLVGAPLVLVAPPIDVVGTAAALANWPRLVPGVHAHAVTSWDRSGGNEDGFAGTYSVLYQVNGEHVIFDALGPGALRTLWFTSDVDGNGPLRIGKLRFYFDDEDAPRFTLDAADLYAGASKPFEAPLAVGNQVSSGGFASWAPLVYRRRLIITTEKRPGFYQAFYDSFPRDWRVASTSAGTTTDAPLASLFEATGFSSVPLIEVALDHGLTGAGTIDVLRFEPEGTPSTSSMQTARIRIWFDGASDPQVDVPLGMFFGSGLGVANVRAIPWTMEPGRWESRFPMPFYEGARVAVTGLPGRLFLHVGSARGPRSEIGTFMATSSIESPTTPGKDHVYADVTGTGKLVGTVLAVEPTSPTTKQWWEGDMRTYVDDLATPSLHGTGHEDDHLGGWSNEFLKRPFTLPMQGCPKTEILDDPPAGQTNANATMYRLFPGVPFYRRLAHSTEHGSGNAREAAYGSVAFLYRQPRVRLVPSDAKAVAPEVGMTTVHLAIEKDNVGVELRRTYDATTRRQRARVVVDGFSIGDWYTADSSGLGEGTEDVLFVPAQVSKGKSALDITLIPEGPFTVTRLATWSVLP